MVNFCLFYYISRLEQTWVSSAKNSRFLVEFGLTAGADSWSVVAASLMLAFLDPWSLSLWVSSGDISLEVLTSMRGDSELVSSSLLKDCWVASSSSSSLVLDCELGKIILEGEDVPVVGRTRGELDSAPTWTFRHPLPSSCVQHSVSEERNVR